MVTVEDYAQIDGNLGKTNASWLDGDLNFDGLVTVDDYATVDGALGAGNGAAGGPQL
jgi:hypothetical protein